MTDYPSFTTAARGLWTDIRRDTHNRAQNSYARILTIAANHPIKTQLVIVPIVWTAGVTSIRPLGRLGLELFNRISGPIDVNIAVMRGVDAAFMTKSLRRIVFRLGPIAGIAVGAFLSIRGRQRNYHL